MHRSSVTIDMILVPKSKDQILEELNQISPCKRFWVIFCYERFRTNIPSEQLVEEVKKRIPNINAIINIDKEIIYNPMTFEAVENRLFTIEVSEIKGRNKEFFTFVDKWKFDNE